jgi:hypothetical protein
VTDAGVTAPFDGLFDDAAPFPPGAAPRIAAVPAHRGLSSRPGGPAGPFAVPAARLEELEDGERFPLSLIGSVGALHRLREDDGTALAEAVGSWSPDRGARARAASTSFGTCSVLEPVDDLVGLGPLPPLERIPA